MSNKKESVHFVHKTENGRYNVWVYQEDFNQPISWFSESCDASKEKKVKKLYNKALAEYQKRSKANVEWEEAV